MKNVRTLRTVLGAAIASTAVCAGAWSGEIKVVVDPVVPGEKPTVITQTIVESTPAPEVVVVKDAVKGPQYRHESLLDSSGNVIDSIVVKIAPPALKEEVMRVESRPAENAAWIPGYWRWDGDTSAYEWVPGVWRRAIPGMTWTPGHWNKFANGYEWIPGFWTSGAIAPATVPTTTTKTTTVESPSSSTTTKTVYAHEAPPALKVETRTASPGADRVWVPGNWTYENGGYVWNPGRWDHPAAESMIWSPARWYHTSEGYELVKGHWDYPTDTRTYVVTTK